MKGIICGVLLWVLLLIGLVAFITYTPTDNATWVEDNKYIIACHVTKDWGFEHNYTNCQVIIKSK